ncbi:aminotransferase class I/II-fold pyridoxal phosphate-dependent enzyme [Xanthobacter sp. V4C-4]
MSGTKTQGRLSADAKAALLNRMRATAPGGAPATATTPHYDTSFATLPGFEQLKLMHAATNAFGIPNPFFRTHEGRAGATSVIGGKEVINFASYDYLGLNGAPEVQAAAHAAVDAFGTSVSASRIVAGERAFHTAFERELAAVYGADDAIVYVSGHAANVATIGTLMGPRDVVFHDELMHNSAIVGAQLSRAHRRWFTHNDLDALEAMLVAERGAYGRALIVVEGNYSMDGDAPDLARLVELKQRHGAWLMVDEAHSLGVLGPRGLGVFEAQGVDPKAVDIWMGTLSKTLASCGGYIAGSKDLVDYLKLSAPGFVYSVGLSAPATLSALTALRQMLKEPERVARLQANSAHFLAAARAAGLDTGAADGHAVIPVIVGDSLKAVVLSNLMLDRGVNVLPIIHPAVPNKAARLRFFVTASHTPAQIEATMAILKEELPNTDTFIRKLAFAGLSDMLEGGAGAARG